MDDGGRAGDPLPPGWSCARDPSSGRPFYYHAGAQRSQWEPLHEAGLARCAGELVFQTQHTAWKNRYAIFSVAPVPGTLWLFPGYMTHAVLPRTTETPELPPWVAPKAVHASGALLGEDTESDANKSESLRISVACNLSTTEHVADLPVVWQTSRMC